MELSEATVEDIAQELVKRPFQFSLVLMPEIDKYGFALRLPESELQSYLSDRPKQGVGTILLFGLLETIKKQIDLIMEWHEEKDDFFVRAFSWRQLVEMMERDMVELAKTLDDFEDDDG